MNGGNFAFPPALHHMKHMRERLLEALLLTALVAVVLLVICCTGGW